MLFNNVKEEFPTLFNNPDLVYLDSAASTQTHKRVLDKMNQDRKKKIITLADNFIEENTYKT